MLLSLEDRIKAHQSLDQLLDRVDERLIDDEREDQIEAGVFSDLLSLGLGVLQASVDVVVREELADARPIIERNDAANLVRIQRPTRRLRTVFGELLIDGPVYAVRAKQKIELAPVDQRLGLPDSQFSYLLESWAQRMVVKDAFDEAAGSLHELLGLTLSVRSLEVMNRRMAADVEAFHDQQIAPPAQDEGQVLVLLSDATGVPMRHRDGGMQMASVGAAYSIDRFVRTADDVLDEVLRKQCAKGRPRPVFKRLYADMTRPLPEDPTLLVDGRVGVFSWLAHEAQTRNVDGLKPVVCLMDGEAKLWERKSQLLGESVVEILDLWHVIEYLRKAGAALWGAQTDEAKQFVSERLRQLLEGHVGRVIGGLRQMLTKRGLKGLAHETFRAAITYYENNRERMHYDIYLREGYPIASGVIEGACRHVVGDRLDRTGMRWSLTGAVAMLATRTTYLSDDWQTYQAFRIQREQSQLYPTSGPT